MERVEHTTQEQVKFLKTMHNNILKPQPRRINNVIDNHRKEVTGTRRGRV